MFEFVPTFDDSLRLGAAIFCGLGVFFLARAVIGSIADLGASTQRAMVLERRERPVLDRLIRALGIVFEPASLAFPEGYIAAIEQRLVFAGRPHGGITARQYIGAMVAFSCLGALAFSLVISSLELGGSGTLTSAPVFLAGCVGFALTLVAGLNRVTTSAELAGQAIMREFPFFLDLAILTVQAGGSPEMALDGYVAASPDSFLAKEIEITARDAQASTVDIALTNMIDRIEPQPIRQILRNLAQADKSTGNLAQYYAEQAHELRTIRAELAERAVDSLKLKLKIPEFMIVSGIVIGTLAPAVVQMGLL